MDFLSNLNWEQISVGVAAIIALIVMIKLNAKSNEKLIQQFGETNGLLAKQLNEAQSVFRNYVNQNNHTMTDLVKESTTAHVRGTEALGVHTKLLEKLVDKLER